MKLNILADALRAAALVLDGAETGTTAETRSTRVAGPKETKGKGKKAARAADDADDIMDDSVDAEEVEASDDMDEVDEVDEVDEDLADDEDEGEVTKEELQAAFKTFINKRKVKGKIDKALNRKEAIKVLKYVKAKSVDDIKPKDYAKVLEQLA